MVKCKAEIYLQNLIHSVRGTLKCEDAPICEKVAKCENISTLNLKIDAICEKVTLDVKNRLSKCMQHFDSKCLKIDATFKYFKGKYFEILPG